MCVSRVVLPLSMVDNSAFSPNDLTYPIDPLILPYKLPRKQWQVATGLLSGQVKKHYQRRKLVRVRQVIRLGTDLTFTESLQALGFSGRVNTAFIERVNLTIRRGVAALARRTWATALQTPHLEAHLHWWQASYHFVRPHASLRVTSGQPLEREGKLRAQRYRQRTEADGSRANHAQMDSRGGTLLPASTYPCLRATKAGNPPTIWR
jgi:hypothetical protein